jgi:KDO2-lipid IV(A) lauroyltransferase
MFYIIYPVFYLLSLLPWWFIYLISDFLYFIAYYVAGYRKRVVMTNLAIAFPEKTEEERIHIAKLFYHQFIDSLVEMIKLISISKEEFQKRFAVNIEVLNDLYDSTDKIEVVTGHFFSWEFANLGVSLLSKFPFIVVYMPLANKSIDRLIYKMRSKFGTLLVSATEFKNSFHIYTENKYSLILVADQNPGNPKKAFWLPFFGKLAPFVKGPEKGAKNSNATVLYANFYKVKRGHYKTDLELVTNDPNSFAEGELTKLLVKKVEDSVKNNPSNYLWSHRRWKVAYDALKYEKLVVK